MDKGLTTLIIIGVLIVFGFLIFVGFQNQAETNAYFSNIGNNLGDTNGRYFSEETNQKYTARYVDPENKQLDYVRFINPETDNKLDTNETLENTTIIDYHYDTIGESNCETSHSCNNIIYEGDNISELTNDEGFITSADLNLDGVWLTDGSSSPATGDWNLDFYNLVTTGKVTSPYLNDTSLDGLILGYNFSIVVDDQITDSSTSGWNGTLINSPVKIDAPFSGAAYEFNGSDQYIAVDGYVKPSSNEYTLMAWVKPDGASAGGTILGATYTYEYGLDITWAGGADYIQVRSGYNQYKYSDYIFDDDDVWVHVALTRDSSGNYVFYRNGVSAGSGSGLNFGGNEHFYIGRNFGGDYFEGGINDPRMYDKVLTADEISAIVNRKQILPDGSISSAHVRINENNNFVVDNDIISNTTTSFDYSNLIAAFNFAESNSFGSLLFDSGLNNNHATIANLTFGEDDYDRSYGEYGASTSVVVPTASGIVGSGKTYVIVYKTPSGISTSSVPFDIDGKVRLRLNSYGQADLYVNGTNVKGWGTTQYWTNNKWYVDAVVLNSDNTTEMFHVGLPGSSLDGALVDWGANNHTTPSGDDDLYIGSSSGGTLEVAGVQMFMAFDEALSIEEINKIVFTKFIPSKPTIPSGDVYVDANGDLIATNKLGVGTIPNSKFHVVDTTGGYNVVGKIENTGDPVAGATRFSIKNSVSELFLGAYGSGAPGYLAGAVALNAITGNLIFGTEAGKHMYLYTNGNHASPVLTLLSSKFVGVNTTNPRTTFEIKSAGSGHGFNLAQANNTIVAEIKTESDGDSYQYLRNGAGTPKVLLSSNGESYFKGGSLLLENNSVPQLKINNSTMTRFRNSSIDASIEMWKNSTPTKAIQFGMGGQATGLTDGDFLIETYSSGGSWLEKFRVKNNGDVVIQDNLNVIGDYYADGSVGWTGTCNHDQNILVTNGIITGCV